jgi:N-acetylglutamate synthase-like GNAT family acetyltransferase
LRELALLFEPDPTPEQIQLLEDRLYEFNSSTTGISDGRALAFFVRDRRNEVVAGAAGHTWGGCCELRQVWVHESLRRQGLGRRLMDSAEREAEQRGCRQMVLTTHSFQAPEFYQKLGFQVVAQLEDYPHGHGHILMRKHLGPRTRSS